MRDSSDDEPEKKNLPATVDGFDDVEDGVEGADEQRSDRVIQGERLTFSNDFVWLTGDDEEFPEERELLVVDTVKVVQKWVNQLPVEAIVVTPGHKWPDVDKLNDVCPKTEWGEDFNGKPRGPWQKTRVTYFIDLNTMEKFTWPASTVGGDICIREFRDKVANMRKFRGARVFAIVKLGDAYMHTRFGGRQRPDLKIARWIMLGPDGTALPAPSTPSLLPASSGKSQLDDFAKSAEPTKEAKPTAETPAGFQTIDEPSLSEQMGGDKVQW